MWKNAMPQHARQLQSPWPQNILELMDTWGQPVAHLPHRPESPPTTENEAEKHKRRGAREERSTSVKPWSKDYHIKSVVEVPCLVKSTTGAHPE